jgi:hypothetical protein
LGLLRQPHIIYTNFDNSRHLFNSIKLICYPYVKSKNESCYIEVLKKIIEIVGCVSVEILILDFEPALGNAFKKVLGEIKIQHCLFHFGQIIYRNLQKSGFSKLYVENPRFRNDVRKILSLAFLPVSCVFRGFYAVICEIKRYVEDLKNFNEFVNFFERNYLTPEKIPMWNANERLKLGIPLTTNSCEGFHNYLNRSFDYAHPSIEFSLEEIRKINQVVCFSIAEHSKFVVKKSIDCYSLDYVKLLHLVEDFDESTDLFIFLFAISNQYQWKLN